MKKKIYYNTVGCGPLAGINNGTFFPQEIYDKYEFVLSKKPDFVFYSCFIETIGEIRKYPNAVKIFFSGENVSPDFNFFDYWVGFDFITFEDRYFRNPLCFWRGEYIKDKSFEKHEKAYFCDFIYSHDDNNHRRETVFKELSKYKQVSSFGKMLNNTGIIVNKTNKADVQSKCKFSLVIESTDVDGFLTEKLIHALKAGSVPIFFGTSKVSEYFNTKRFINANEYSSLDEVIEAVKEIDNNDALYNKMLQQPIYNPKFDLDKLNKDYIIFLDNIFSKEPVLRRDVQYSNNHYYKMMKFYTYGSLPVPPVVRFLKKVKSKLK